MEELRIKQNFTLVEHPQTNGQAKAAKQIIVRGLKRKLEESKGNWVDEPPHVSWDYCTTPYSAI